MEAWMEQLMAGGPLRDAIGLGITLLLLISALLVVSWGVGAFLKKHSSPHAAKIAQKFLMYLGYAGILFTLLLELGIDLTGLLATAGIATVAIGFAAQTSLSNLISGLFLLGEKPFKLGDLIRVDGNLGLVESIDLLSTKLRTLDNLFIRVPNEQMLKVAVTNITRYPIRRMDFTIGVAYKENIAHVMQVLKELADANPLVLNEPEPLLLFDNFGDSALLIRYGVWFEKSQYLEVRNSLLREIKERFDAEGIEIPFPHRSLYSGSATDPFPIRIVSPEESIPRKGK